MVNFDTWYQSDDEVIPRQVATASSRFGLPVIHVMAYSWRNRIRRYVAALLVSC
jgi:hypothetical protein